MVITLGFGPSNPGSSPGKSFQGFNRGVAQRERDRLITYRSLDRNQPSRNKIRRVILTRLAQFGRAQDF